MYSLIRHAQPGRTAARSDPRRPLPRRRGGGGRRRTGGHGRARRSERRGGSVWGVGAGLLLQAPLGWWTLEAIGTEQFMAGVGPGDAGRGFGGGGRGRLRADAGARTDWPRPMLVTMVGVLVGCCWWRGWWQCGNTRGKTSDDAIRSRSVVLAASLGALAAAARSAGRAGARGPLAAQAHGRAGRRGPDRHRAPHRQLARGRDSRSASVAPAPLGADPPRRARPSISRPPSTWSTCCSRRSWWRWSSC